MLIGRDGIIVRANRALKRLLGGDAERALSEFSGQDDDRFDLYLERCLGSGEPLVGSIILPLNGRAQKMQCKGSAVRFEEGNMVLLRLSVSGEPRFAALTETVLELEEELKKRRRSEAQLRESVAERDLLLRELEHRVKNNMQMLSALISGAEREASSAEARAALKNASLRFSAVSAVQQLLYRSGQLEAIGSQALVKALMEAISTLSAEPLRAEVNVDSIDLPIEVAVPIGLILNELLTNAVKYGRPSSGTRELRVGFVSNENKIRIVVQDNGPGFDPSVSRKRASGIGLVRGLLRQLGGSLAVEQDGGSRCIVTLPAPQRATVRNIQ